MPNSVTNRQLFFIILVTVLSQSIINISKILAQSAGTGAWLTLLITTLIIGLFTMAIVRLNTLFPGKMLFDYSQELIGKMLTYVLSVLLILFFSFATVYFLVNFSALINTTYLLRTPQWATMLFGVPVFCFVAYKGVTNVARIMEIIGIVYISTGIFVHISMFAYSNPVNILPLFDNAEIGRYLSAVKDTYIFYIGIGVLLIIPMAKGNGGKKAVRTSFWALFSVGMTFIMIVESCIMKIGINDIVYYKNSIIVANRDFEIPFLDFLKRIDALFMMIGVMAGFLGLSIFIMAIVELVCRIFKKASRLAVVLCTGAVLYSLWVVSSGLDGFSDYAAKAIGFISPVVVFIIPCVLLLIAKVKRNVQTSS